MLRRGGATWHPLTVADGRATTTFVADRGTNHLTSTSGVLATQTHAATVVATDGQVHPPLVADTEAAEAEQPDQRPGAVSQTFLCETDRGDLTGPQVGAHRPRTGERALAWLALNTERGLTDASPPTLSS